MGREVEEMLRNPCLATCGFVDWKGTAGAATDREGSWMACAIDFHTVDERESASFIFEFFSH